MITPVLYQWIDDMFTDISESKIMRVSVNDVILYSLIYCMSRSGRQCTISQKRMAQRLRMSRNTVNESLKKLENANLVRRTRVNQSSNIYSYRAIVPAVYVGAAAEEHRKVTEAMLKIKE